MMAKAGHHLCFRKETDRQVLVGRSLFLIFKIMVFYVSIYLFVYECMCMCMCMWRSEDSLGKSLLSFHHEGPRM